ncbi:HAD family hydrolase [Altericista sp. CCNU0014]|uniref:HAD family hydrolase n=1 Tax=Altericista sp. CCNU0014 TaxID=3082949 RepID=UPI003850A40A
MSIGFAEGAAESSNPVGAGGYGCGVSMNLTVFCDLDGPLIDVSRRYYKTYQLAIAETQAYFQVQGRSLLLTPLSESQFWQMKQERMPDEDIAFCSGLRYEQIDLFLSNVLEIVNQPILLQEDRLQPGVRRSLEQLRQRGVRLSLVTLRCQMEAQQLLQELNLAHHFDYICGAEDRFSAYQNYAAGKQAILENLIRNANDDSSQFWVIGDTEADVLAGQALGLSTVALTCGIRSHAYLQRLEPTTVLPDLPAAVCYLLANAK